MSITQQDLDQLDEAIVSGALTVSFQGRTVTYQSTDQLIKARDHAARVLRQQSGGRPGVTFGGARVAFARFD